MCSVHQPQRRARQAPRPPAQSRSKPRKSRNQAQPSGGINHSVAQRTSHLELRPSSTGAGRKKSDHGSAPDLPVPSGCNSREWQRGNDAVHPLPPWWRVVGDATTTTARTDHSLSPWWRVAHPVHLLPCCCPAHLTRAEARMAPPMIIGMKSRSPHLDGCGSVERRSPRNTRVDPTRMGVAAVLTMKSEEPEAHPTRMGVAETFQTLSA